MSSKIFPKKVILGKTHKLSKDKEATAMVKRVGERIAAAVEEYFKEKGMSLGRAVSYICSKEQPWLIVMCTRYCPRR